MTRPDPPAAPTTRRLAVLALLPVLAAGCGASSAPAASGSTAAAAGPATAQTVEVQGDQQLQFQPGTVTARVGTLRLTFSLAGGTPHDLVFQDGSVGPAIPTVTSAARTGTYTFSRPGTYVFECTLHPGMEGKVVVS